MNRHVKTSSVGYETTVDGFTSSTSVWLQPSRETFASGNLIRVSNARKPDNNQIFEVVNTRLKHPDCWTLWINPHPSEAFCSSSFVQDFSDHQAIITKINVSVLRAAAHRLGTARAASSKILMRTPKSRRQFRQTLTGAAFLGVGVLFYLGGPTSPLVAAFLGLIFALCAALFVWFWTKRF